MSLLITFDIDGTLIRFGGESAKHPLAFRNAFNELLKLNINVYPEQYINLKTDGWTDLQLCIKMLEKANRNPDVHLLKEFQQKIENHYFSIIKPNFALVPGVHTFLSSLSKNPKVTMGIATGNFQKIAMMKLELSGLDKYFTSHFGGFGDVNNRNEVLKNALREANIINLGPFDRMVHIGDTTADAKSAFDVGLEPVIVMTGKQKGGFPPNSNVFENFETDYAKIMKFLRL